MAKGTISLIFKAADAKRVIAWPCPISVPLEGGKREEQTVTPRFRLMKSDEVEKYFDTLGRVTDPGRRFGNIAFLEDVIEGFDGLKDESGAAVADDAAKEYLLSLPYGVDGLVRGYFDMIGRRLPKN
jgi:hypothetical protein